MMFSVVLVFSSLFAKYLIFSNFTMSPPKRHPGKIFFNSDINIVFRNNGTGRCMMSLQRRTLRTFAAVDNRYCYIALHLASHHLKHALNDYAGIYFGWEISFRSLFSVLLNLMRRFFLDLHKFSVCDFTFN